jgi:hypothetical protein
MTLIDRKSRFRLREYFLKHRDIAQYSDEYPEKAVWVLNTARANACSGKRPTEVEVYFEEVLPFDLTTRPTCQSQNT